MALLVSAQSLKKTFGAKPLFSGVSLTINDGDRLDSELSLVEGLE